MPLKLSISFLFRLISGTPIIGIPIYLSFSSSWGIQCLVFLYFFNGPCPIHILLFGSEDSSTCWDLEASVASIKILECCCMQWANVTVPLVFNSIFWLVWRWGDGINWLGGFYKAHKVKELSDLTWPDLTIW